MAILYQDKSQRIWFWIESGVLVVILALLLVLGPYMTWSFPEYLHFLPLSAWIAIAFAISLAQAYAWGFGTTFIIMDEGVRRQTWFYQKEDTPYSEITSVEPFDGYIRIKLKYGGEMNPIVDDPKKAAELIRGRIGK